MNTKISKQMGARQIPVILLFLALLNSVNSQRVAPGVPPQHYQQVPVQQHQQQQVPVQQYQQQPQMQHAPGVAPQHYQQQQQVQYQQVPVQQQQQQQYQQQQPVQPQFQQQQQHQQPHGVGQPQVLNTGNLQHERAHIQEHMQVPIDTSKMSEAELQFHYFKMHDSDNNNKLDGCELIKSLIHWHGDEHDSENVEGTGKKNGTVYTDKNLADIIDYVLNTMDSNKDGYVDYSEYRKSELAKSNT